MAVSYTHLDVYKRQVVYKVSAWLTIKPPTIAMPSGRLSSDPIPVPIANGTPPSSAAMVVIMIGRNLSRDAWKTASLGLLWSRLSTSRAKSIIMIAFFLTIPIRRMIPIKAMMLSSVCVIMSARRAPTPADGSVERIVMGWM